MLCDNVVQNYCQPMMRHGLYIVRHIYYYDVMVMVGHGSWWFSVFHFHSVFCCLLLGMLCPARVRGVRARPLVCLNSLKFFFSRYATSPI